MFDFIIMKYNNAVQCVIDFSTQVVVLYRRHLASSRSFTYSSQIIITIYAVIFYFDNTENHAHT